MPSARADDYRRGKREGRRRIGFPFDYEGISGYPAPLTYTLRGQRLVIANKKSKIMRDDDGGYGAYGVQPLGRDDGDVQRVMVSAKEGVTEENKSTQEAPCAYVQVILSLSLSGGRQLIRT